MLTPELRDLIENELRRMLIQNHPNFTDWYASLAAHSQLVIDGILEEDVTSELILFSQEAPEFESATFQFLSIIGGGNPNPADSSALTNSALADILLEVREFGTAQE